MPGSTSQTESAEPNPNDRIRDAGKWLIGASAAVGAALIAGSQLSNIGALPLCFAESSTCLRLPISIAGAAIALAGIAYIMWGAVKILLPVGTTIEELIEAWRDAEVASTQTRRRKPRADVAFFQDNLGQIGDGGPTALKESKSEAWEELKQARRDFRTASDKTAAKQVVEAAESKLERAVANMRRVLEVAAYQLLLARFEALLARIVITTVLIAIGIVTFAWASNPPPSSADLSDTVLTGADLRGADLVNTNLNNANLGDVDLSGANLGGASVKGVLWSNTVCPDGTNSNDSTPETCVGHLSP